MLESQGLIVSTQIDDVSDSKNAASAYVNKINEANELIARAEAQLAERHRSLLMLIKITEDEIKKKAELLATMQYVDNVMGNSKIDTAIEEQDAKLTNKQLYKKIAQVTHPDKSNNSELFVRAKKALKNNDREELMRIMAEAELDYEEILLKRRAEYNALITSEPYCLATAWFSGDKERMDNIAFLYRHNLLNVLAMKQAML